MNALIKCLSSLCSLMYCSLLMRISILVWFRAACCSGVRLRGGQGYGARMRGDFVQGGAVAVQLFVYLSILARVCWAKRKSLCFCQKVGRGSGAGELRRLYSWPLMFNGKICVFNLAQVRNIGQNKGGARWLRKQNLFFLACSPQ